ncbi:hypothetical protein ABH920_004925 [Catenulispora sp. EB89]|uniref:DUF6228 family protein n=1 Tax=Catenulispora sp. EB89 TaxID=3156257 RepID=UPI0035160D64
MNRETETFDEVAIPHRCAGDVVTLHECRRPHNDALVVFGVRVDAHGLSASMGIETLNGDGLDAFVQTLDNDFRGWSGERVWTSSRGDLEVRARHVGKAIQLDWTLRFPEPVEQSPDWELTVHLHVDPGESLKDLSTRIAAFLDV